MIWDLPVKWVTTLSEVKQLAVRLEELRCQRWAEDARYVYLAGLGVPSLNRLGEHNIGYLSHHLCNWTEREQSLVSY